MSNTDLIILFLLIGVIILIILLNRLTKDQQKNLSATKTADAQRTSTAIVFPTTLYTNALTESARPKTPFPTFPPDLRSPFEKCLDNNTGIAYAVTSTGGVGKISLTFPNDTGGVSQGEYDVPFCKQFSDFVSGDFLYISAQITRGEGNIVCAIYDGKSIISKAEASGFASIATCKGSK